MIHNEFFGILVLLFGLVLSYWFNNLLTLKGKDLTFLNILKGKKGGVNTFYIGLGMAIYYFFYILIVTSI